tara:strand:+ start:1315 stop:1533 length:219 start_codon:yes stop_codon:yes gene_type:complete
MKSFVLGLLASAIIIAGLLIVGGDDEKPKESNHEAFVESVEFIEFDEPMKVHIEVQYLDFSDEEPMVITPED